MSDRQKAVSRLVGFIQTLDDVDESSLDELVHDVKSGEAADINNGGFESQIEFLLEAGFSEQEIQKAIQGE